MNAPYDTDLSSPLLLRSESDEGVKDWFERNGRSNLDPLINLEERLLIIIISILTMIQSGFLVGAYYLPWLSMHIESSFITAVQHAITSKNLSLLQFLSLIKLSLSEKVTIFATAFVIPPILILINVFYTIVSIRSIGFGFLCRSTPATMYHFTKLTGGRIFFSGMNLLCKFQLVVFYMFITYLITMSKLQISTGKKSADLSVKGEYATTNRVAHEIRGGMISFLISVLSGSMALFIIHILSRRFVYIDQDCQTENEESRISSRGFNEIVDKTDYTGFRSPPASAFKRIPWTDALSHRYEDEDNNGLPFDSTCWDFTDLSGLTPNIDQDGDKDENNMDEPRPRHKHENLLPVIGLSDVLRFEICLLAIILWVPILTLPIFYVRVQGIFSFLIDSTSPQTSSINIWNILSLLMIGGISKIFNILSAIFFIHQVIISPVLLLSFYTVAWYRKETGSHETTSDRLWIKLSYPLASTIPFIIGMVIVINNIGFMSHSLFDQSYVCEYMLNMLNDENGECLVLQAQFGAGIWLFLTEGLCLETMYYIM
jgi:hypothetical protein